MRCCKFPKRCKSNSSNSSDYVNIGEITSTQHYTRIALNRFPEEKLLGNDRMEMASTEVTSIRHRNDIEKSMWRTHRYFVNFGSRIHVEIYKLDRCYNFHVHYEISTNFPRGILMSN